MRRNFLPRLKPSSGEAVFSPVGKGVPRRLHVPSGVIREQWPDGRVVSGIRERASS